MKKILLSSVILLSLITSSVSAWYEEIACDALVFSENSCTQCFDGWVKSEESNLGLLTDVWTNKTSNPMYMLKWENSLENSVEMIPLNGAVWLYEPTKENFWEYTSKLDSLDSDGWFYTLEGGQSVDWIESKLGYSIKLNKSSEKGSDIGLLKYSLKVHMDNNGSPIESTISHNECVLFKSAEAPLVQTEEAPKQLPQTWPQEVLLLLLAIMLSALLFFASKRKA
jgi:LPXTG-motif cell wall-anchored protein